MDKVGTLKMALANRKRNKKPLDKVEENGESAAYKKNEKESSEDSMGNTKKQAVKKFPAFFKKAKTRK